MKIKRIKQSCEKEKNGESKLRINFKKSVLGEKARREGKYVSNKNAWMK